MISDQKILESLQLAMHHIPGYTLLKRPDSSYIDGNLKTARLFGFQRTDQLIGITDYDMRCPAADYADIFVAQDIRLIEQKEELIILDIHPYASGYKSLLINKSLVQNAKHENLAIVCQCTEISGSVLFKIAMRIVMDTNQLIEDRRLKRAISLFICDRYKGLGLSVRQSECLFYLIRGKTAKTIGDRLHLSPRTIESHIEDIKIKLNCHSKQELIGKAIHLGYTELIPRSVLSIEN